MKLRHLLPLALFALLAVFLAVGLQRNPRELPSALIGKPAPTFTLPQLVEPGSSPLPATMKGRVWLLNVWASWCSGCRVEHPLLMEIARSQAVPLVGLNYKDERPAALKFLAQGGDPYRFSAHDLDGRVGIDYGVYGLPETFVIDRDGVIRHKHIGPLTEEALRSTILPLVNRLSQP